jgi:glycosyltransferase involved in cell wall biosynthesis
MKILLSAYAFEPNLGSESGNGWNWSYYLTLRGHEVHVMTRIQGKESIERELSKNKIQNLYVHYVDIPNWSKRFLSGQTSVYLHYLLWQKQAYQFAKTIAPNIDIMHHVTWGSLRGGSELWKIDKPFVFGPIGGGQVAPSAFAEFFEDEWPKEALRTFSINNIKSFFPGAVKTIQNADMVLCCNQETLKVIRENKARQSHLFLDAGLPLNFIPEQLPFRMDDERLNILWVGRVYALKGLKLALSALEKVHIPYKLNIVGDGPWGHKIPGWIKMFGLGKNVEWFGQLPWTELTHFYSQSNVFLFTSIRESFGSQLLEAMAYGLPIITLDHFGASTFIPADASIKIPVKTPQETVNNLSKAIEKIWQEPERRKRMGEAAFNYSKSVTWDKKVLEMEEIYKSLLLSKEH